MEGITLGESFPVLLEPVECTHLKLELSLGANRVADVIGMALNYLSLVRDDGVAGRCKTFWPEGTILVG